MPLAFETFLTGAVCVVSLFLSLPGAHRHLEVVSGHVTLFSCLHRCPLRPEQLLRLMSYSSVVVHSELETFPDCMI